VLHRDISYLFAGMVFIYAICAVCVVEKKCLSIKSVQAYHIHHISIMREICITAINVADLSNNKAIDIIAVSMPMSA
jgi:hypothetical protein